MFYLKQLRYVAHVRKGLPKSDIGLNSVKHVHRCFVDFQKDAIEDLQESRMNP